MSFLNCWVLVAVLALTVTAQSQDNVCVLSPNEPPQRTGQFLASQGQAVTLDDLSYSCGMDPQNPFQGEVMMPLHPGQLQVLQLRKCFAVECIPRQPRTLHHQMLESGGTTITMCPNAGGSSRRKRQAPTLCGHEVSTPLTGKEFTLTLWIQPIADGVFLRSQLLEVFVANEHVLFVRTAFAGRSRGYQLKAGKEHQLALQVRTNPGASQEISVFIDGTFIESLYYVDTKNVLMDDVAVYSLTPFTLGPFDDSDMPINVGNVSTVAVSILLPADPNADSNSDVTTCAWLEQTILTAGVNALVSCELMDTQDPTLQEARLVCIQEYSVPYIDSLVETAISRAPAEGEINMRSVSGVGPQTNQLDGTGPQLHLYLYEEAPIDSPTCQNVLGRKMAPLCILGVDSKFYNYFMIFHELQSLGDAATLTANGTLVGLFCSLFYPDSKPDKTAKLPCQSACFAATNGLPIGPKDSNLDICTVLPTSDCVTSNELPTATSSAQSQGFQGVVRNIRIYNGILTNREIEGNFHGQIPVLDINTECFCPDGHPRAVYSLVPDNELDVWCTTNYDTALRTLRLQPDSSSGGLFLKESLVDGMTAFHDASTWNMWVSKPGVEDFTIDVDLGGVVVVKEVRLHYMTPPPDVDGYFLFYTRLDGQWTGRQAFSWSCQRHTWGAVNCTSLSQSSRDAIDFSPRTEKWQLGFVQAADAVRVKVKGRPHWTTAGYRSMAKAQYHALTELAVEGVEEGCVCYAAGTDATCDHYGQCRCLPGVDPKLAGKQCMPYVTSMSPRFGPRSGGTIVIFRGVLLDKTSAIMLGELQCNIIIRNFTHVVCETPAAPDNAQLPWNISARVRLPCGDLEKEKTDSTRLTFQYLPDPVITGIEPRTSILSGGIVQTVSGEHINSVPDPYLLIYLYKTETGPSRRKRSTSGGRPETVLVTSGINRTLDLDLPDNLFDILFAKCNVIDCCSMECPVPALDSITNVTENGTVPLEAYVGLLLDDVEPYQNFQNNTDLADIAEIILFADPTFNDFTEKGRVRVFRPYPPYKHHSVEIVGKNMIGGAQLGDYKVSIGDGECSIYQLDGNTMLCHAPQSPPEDSISHRGPRVVVSVGRINLAVGYLQYVLWWDSNIFSITAGCCSATILAGLVCLIYACVFVRPTIPAATRSSSSVVSSPPPFQQYPVYNHYPGYRQW